MGTVEEGSMSNLTGRRAGLAAPPWVWRGVVLAGALAVAQPAATFGAGVDTYQWLGELVALDEGARAVTVTARVVAPAGLNVAGLERGDPILITWSGVGPPRPGNLRGRGRRRVGPVAGRPVPAPGTVRGRR